MLHTVNKKNLIDLCLRVIQSNDTLLLIEEAVYALSELKFTTNSFLIYALQVDVEARGVKINHFNNHVVLIDFEGFVQLTEQNIKSVSWY